MVEKRGISTVALIIYGTVTTVIVLLLIFIFVSTLTPVDAPNPTTRFVTKVALELDKYLSPGISPGPLGPLADFIVEFHFSHAGCPKTILIGKNPDWYYNPIYCREITRSLDASIVDKLRENGYLPYNCNKLKEFLKDENHKKKYYLLLVNYLVAKAIVASAKELTKDDGSLSDHDIMLRTVCLRYPDFDFEDNDLYIGEGEVTAIIAAWKGDVCPKYITNYITTPSSELGSLIYNNLDDNKKNECFNKPEDKDDDMIIFQGNPIWFLYKNPHGKIKVWDKWYNLDEINFFKNVVHVEPKYICMLVGVDDLDKYLGADNGKNIFVIKTLYIFRPKDWNFKDVFDDIKFAAQPYSYYPSGHPYLACYLAPPWRLDDKAKQMCYELFPNINRENNPFEKKSNEKMPLNVYAGIRFAVYGAGYEDKSIKFKFYNYLSQKLCPSKERYGCLNPSDPVINYSMVSQSDLYFKIANGQIKNPLHIEISDLVYPQLPDTYDDNIIQIVKDYVRAIRRYDSNLSTSTVYIYYYHSPSGYRIHIVHPFAFLGSSRLSGNPVPIEDFKAYGLGNLQFYVGDGICPNSDEEHIYAGFAPLCKVQFSNPNNPDFGAIEYIANVPDYDIKIIIENPNDYNLQDYQVRVDLGNYYDPNANGYLKILDENGNELDYCYEQQGGACNTNPSKVIWVKVPYIPANGKTTLYVYFVKTNHAKEGTEVFDFYEDFEDGNLDGWITPFTNNYGAWATKDVGNPYNYVAYAETPRRDEKSYDIAKKVNLIYNSNWAWEITATERVSGEPAFPDDLWFYIYNPYIGEKRIADLSIEEWGSDSGWQVKSATIHEWITRIRWVCVDYWARSTECYVDNIKIRKKADNEVQYTIEASSEQIHTLRTNFAKPDKVGTLVFPLLDANNASVEGLKDYDILVW